jgi:hypothetical protein
MFDPTLPANNSPNSSAQMRASSTASKISSTPFPPDRRGRLERRVPKGRRVIPADRQDRKARRAPTATMVRLVRPEMMALPVPKGRREMKGQRVPKARKGRRVPRVRLDHKARPEPMDSREGLLARKGHKARPAWMALKGRRERMGKVRRGR